MLDEQRVHFEAIAGSHPDNADSGTRSQRAPDIPGATQCFVIRMWRDDQDPVAGLGFSSVAICELGSCAESARADISSSVSPRRRKG